MAQRARIALMNEIAAEDALLFSPHFPFPGCGKLVKSSEAGIERFCFVPATRNQSS